jgi:DUF4097 and DUF4098 domain-containing protein YvlB
MRRRIMHSLAVGICVLLASAAFASEQGRFEKRLNVGGGADLEVLTRSGNVTVHSGSSGSIDIIGHIHVGDRWFTGNRKADVEAIENNPPIQQNGNSVRINYVDYRDISVDYEITAPADTKLRAKTGSGDQTIEGMQAGVDLETGSGDVRLRELAGDLRVHTGSGNIEGHGVGGPLDARAGSGDLRIEDVGKGDVRVETGSGNIEVRGVEGGLRASTGSGNLRIEGTPASNWSVKTGSGNADVKVPDQVAYDVDLSTSSGSIVVNPAVTTTVQGRVNDSRKEIRGKVRGGGPEIAVHTGSGDIRID